MEVFNKLASNLYQLTDFIDDIQRSEALLIKVEQVPDCKYLITYVHNQELT